MGHQNHISLKISKITGTMNRLNYIYYICYIKILPHLNITVKNEQREQSQIVGIEHTPLRFSSH